MPATKDQTFKSTALYLIMRAPEDSLWARCNHVRQQLAEDGILVGINTLLRWSQINSAENEGRQHTRPKRTQENQERVGALIEQVSGHMPMRQMSRKLKLSYTTLWRIVREDLEMYPYKYQKAQLLSPAAKQKRKNFCLEMLSRLDSDPEYHRKIVFSDETSVQVEPQHNRHNKRVLSKQQPHKMHCRATHPKRVNAICAVNYYLGVIGPFFSLRI